MSNVSPLHSPPFTTTPHDQGEWAQVFPPCPELNQHFLFVFNLILVGIMFLKFCYVFSTNEWCLLLDRNFRALLKDFLNCINSEKTSTKNPENYCWQPLFVASTALQHRVETWSHPICYLFLILCVHLCKSFCIFAPGIFSNSQTIIYTGYNSKIIATGRALNRYVCGVILAIYVPDPQHWLFVMLKQALLLVTPPNPVFFFMKLRKSTTLHYVKNNVNICYVC